MSFTVKQNANLPLLQLALHLSKIFDVAIQVRRLWSIDHNGVATLPQWTTELHDGAYSTLTVN